MAELIIDTIILYRTNPLKAVLRSIHRLMQTSGGTEALRNLVDSELPKSLKRIFEASARFGPRVYALGKHSKFTALMISNQHHGDLRA
jgi:E3 ubiquitin-protein ligase HUWE1